MDERPYASHPHYLRGALEAAITISGGEAPVAKLIEWTPTSETARYRVGWK